MLRSQEKLLVLGQIPLFADLSTADKKFIADSSLIIEYKKDDIVYKEGAEPDALYCVVTGRLKAYLTRNNTTDILEYIKRGKCFGIISLLTGEPHSVTTQTVNDSIILKIPKEHFDRILKRVPELALQFSQLLSRRLKQKEGGKKKIFESTIISVFSLSEKAAASRYARDLGAGLMAQTAKKVVLVTLNESALPAQFFIDSPFFDESALRSKISKQPAGPDIINIANTSKKIIHLAAFLSFLTGDYHYVIVDLHSGVDDNVFDIMKQSDMAHLITACDEKSLDATAKLVAELEGQPIGVGCKVRIITSEPAAGAALGFAERKSILKHDIFATLPGPEDAPYQRMVRRISRQIGDCLIGLALGSGAALGLAHVGILKVIEREKIPIDIVSGSSMGALVAALWASGKSASEIEIITSAFRSKLATFRLFDLTWPARGLIKGRGIRRFLVSQFGKKTFYDVKLPLKIIACDLERREEVVIEEGSIVDAVMASIAIPGVFEPVMINGRALVDGGIINPVPSNVLTRTGVSRIIAVNTLASPEDIRRSDRKLSNIFDFIVNTIEAGEYLLAEMSCQSADVAMHPILPTADWYEFYKSDKLIKRGEEEALKYLPQLKELAAAR